MNDFRMSQPRLAVPVVGLLLTLLVASLSGAAFARSAAAQATATTTTATTAPGVLETPPAKIDCAAGATATATAKETANAFAFAIVSDESEARYRAQEELAGKGANEAVGKTNAFIGQILLGSDGLPLACSRFDVDLRTLTSDEARRDNYLYRNTLETEQYPLATFIVTEVEGLDKPLADGQEATFTLIGNLTVHGATKLVAWQTTATLDGDTLKGNAVTSFDMPDFNITPPKVGPVVSLGETVKLEVDLTAKRAA